MNQNQWSPQFPSMRTEVQYAVATLADEDYQDQVWVKGVFPRDPYLYDFDAACHMLLDDADIMDESDRLIGAILRDEREVGVLRCLGETLLTLIDDISAVGTFEDARRSSKWPPVVAAAKEASKVIGRPLEFP
jgi:hypothetical protein